MFDQADDLRELVKRRMAAERPAVARPRRIVLLGGKGGVGTTTLCVGLGIALARQGPRTVLVDTAGGDAVVLCRLDPRHTIADVLAGTRTAAAALQPGPAGLQILSGSRETVLAANGNPAGLDRLLGQAAAIEPAAGAMLLDAGSRLDPLARRLCEAADVLLVVTTPEPAAVIGSFASIKSLAGAGAAASIHLLVNKASCLQEAEDVHCRLARTCRRFLGLALPSAGGVPADAQVGRSASIGRSILTVAPGGPASRRICRLAEWISSLTPK